MMTDFMDVYVCIFFNIFLCIWGGKYVCSFEKTEKDEQSLCMIVKYICLFFLSFILHLFIIKLGILYYPKDKRMSLLFN